MPWLRLLATGFVVLLIGLSHTTNAHAQAVADPDFWKQTQERQNTVNRFFHGQSPQTIPPEYSSVAEAEQILRDS